MPTLSEVPAFVLLAAGAILGLLWGSFLNVVIHRVPAGQSVVSPGSRCPGCGKAIKPWDNLPLLSYLVLRGRARCCGVRISPRYPLVEAIGGLTAVCIVQLIILELPRETSLGRALLLFAVYLALALALVALAFIDLETMLLPDSITLGGALLGLLSSGLRGANLWDGLFGALLGFLLVYLPFDLLYRLLRGQPGMGLGDAKLMLLAGAWFGWQGAVFALFAGAIQATAAALLVLLLKGRIDEPEAVIREREALNQAILAARGDARLELERERDLDPVMRAPEASLGKARIPFGPFLALATLEYLLFAKAGLDLFLESLFPSV